MIRGDFAVNRSNPKAQLVLGWFRLAHFLRASPQGAKNPLTAVVGVSYRISVEWILGIEIPWKLQVGKRLRLYHGVGIVINDGCVIGDDVTIRQGVTIGHTAPGGPCPVIGNNVEIGAGATIIGRVTVGNGAKIGANALVVHDIPANSVAISPVAKLVSRDED
ncbi:serine acetyltransferase [Gordonia sp. N1V]|uniref:serine O-acetyltransferase n=1 Tax=Gordonia sp. N1V TaxID=3034163 RepID=UPI0023E0C605|nr:serine acetyltransferase [Gordonia sp. N1V]MDF3284675.1 serine acetyltransferase [Gordonia sp. N1V]